MAETTPFLTVDEFEGMFRPLSSAERALAEVLVQAAADWIRDPLRLPDLPVTDPRAKLVTFDVVRGAFGIDGLDSRVRDYKRTTDDRTTEISLAAAAELLDFTERHLRMLGLSQAAEPQAEFDGYTERAQW